MSDELKIIQRLGEDVAYTFKGLYKTADILHFQFKFYLTIPILFSIITLGFSSQLPEKLIIGLSVISLLATSQALLNQKEYEKIQEYRILANQYKDLYDELESAYYKSKIDDSDRYLAEIQKLRKRTSDYPISAQARQKSKNKIREEMNLAWVYENRKS